MTYREIRKRGRRLIRDLNTFERITGGGRTWKYGVPQAQNTLTTWHGKREDEDEPYRIFGARFQPSGRTLLVVRYGANGETTCVGMNAEAVDVLRELTVREVMES